MSFPKHCYISPQQDQIEAFYPCLNKVSNSKKEHPKIGEICLPPDLLSKFYKRSLVNTINNIETLGYLYGFIDENENKAFVAYLFIPEQTGTATSCEAVDPEACGRFQEENNGAVQLGWIHVHPEQACFMSSIDCHVQYHAQRDNKNYIGIVYSHQDREFGIFSISNNGFNVIATCDLNNNNSNNLHHLHKSDDVYVNATHVIYDDELDTTVVDQRKIQPKTISQAKYKPQFGEFKHNGFEFNDNEDDDDDDDDDNNNNVMLILRDGNGQGHAILIQKNNNNNNTNNNNNENGIGMDDIQQALLQRQMMLNKAASECDCPNCTRRRKMKHESNFGNSNNNGMEALEKLQALLQLQQLRQLMMNGALQCNCPNCLQERKWQENEFESQFQMEDSKESKENETDSDCFIVDQNEEKMPQWLTPLQEYKETQDKQKDKERKEETENEVEHEEDEPQQQLQQHKHSTPEILCCFSNFKKGRDRQDGVLLESITVDNCDVVRISITLLQENELKVKSLDKVFIDCGSINITDVSDSVQKHYKKLFTPFANEKNGTIMSRSNFKKYIIHHYNKVSNGNSINNKINEIFSNYSQNGDGLTLNEFFKFCTNAKEKTVSIDLNQDKKESHKYHGGISAIQLINQLGTLCNICIRVKGTYVNETTFECVAITQKEKDSRDKLNQLSKKYQRDEMNELILGTLSPYEQGLKTVIPILYNTGDINDEFVPFIEFSISTIKNGIITNNVNSISLDCDAVRVSLKIAKDDLKQILGIKRIYFDSIISNNDFTMDDDEKFQTYPNNVTLDKKKLTVKVKRDDLFYCDFLLSTLCNQFGKKLGNGITPRAKGFTNNGKEFYCCGGSEYIIRCNTNSATNTNNTNITFEN